MQAVRFAAVGRPAQIEDVPTPSPGPGQASHRDWWRRRLPLGVDGADERDRATKVGDVHQLSVRVGQRPRRIPISFVRPFQEELGYVVQPTNVGVRVCAAVGGCPTAAQL